MKLQLKLDKKTIQEFLLQNVEKIVLGVVVLLFLTILYSSWTSAGRFEKTPEQLQSAVTTARRDIEATTFPEYAKEKQQAGATSGPSDSSNPTASPTSASLDVPDYIGRAKQSRVEIEEKPYVTPVAWDPPLFPKSPLRDAPPLYTVQQLRCAAAIGAFRIRPVVGREDRAERVADRTERRDQTERRDRTERAVRPAPGDLGMPGMGATQSVGGEQLRGQRWIVVTGLVPIQKQELAYAETFKLSRGYDPQTDYPRYLGYWVERVEVNSLNEAAPDWKNATTILSRDAEKAATQEWPTSSTADVVAMQYQETALTFPLGPLVNRRWDAAVAHKPEIPILSSMMGIRKGSDRAEPMGDRPGDIGAMAPGFTGVPMAPMAPGVMGSPMGGARNNQLNLEDTPFGDKEAAAGDQSRQKDARENAQEQGPPAYKLFRFFDFNVESGKRYMYRVRLALANPNYNTPARYLKNPELGKEKYLKTTWSEPSEVIAAPRDTQVLLASVKSSRNNVDPSGEILMTTWVLRKGVEIFKEFTVTRGQVANYSDETGRSVGSGDAPTTPAPAVPGARGGNDRIAAEPAARDRAGRNPRGADSTARNPRGGEAAGRNPRGGGETRGRAQGGLDGLMTGSTGLPGMASGMAPGDSQSAAGKGETFKANFQSDATIIDFRGGERLSGRRGSSLNVPGEMLLLDANGVLVVRNELDDESLRDQVKNPQQPATGIMGVPMMGIPGGGHRPGGLEGM